ncbi:MAG: toxin-antitoxin system YwqK family antitoxin [Deferribacteraceae bacterium]|nr:toxin-antitoxin system YwqK family antitoxin [Deferribacteraceae bacterium]
MAKSKAIITLAVITFGFVFAVQIIGKTSLRNSGIIIFLAVIAVILIPLFLPPKTKTVKNRRFDETVFYGKPDDTSDGEKAPKPRIIQNFPELPQTGESTWKPATLPNEIEGTFFENDGIMPETLYKDRKKYGTEKHYFEDGKLRLATQYKDDIREGVEKEYNREGRLIRETPFKGGKKQGTEKLYRSNGRMMSAVYYGKAGKREGEARFYDENAKITAEIIYSDDKPVSGFKADRKSGGKFPLNPDELEKYV